MGVSVRLYNKDIGVYDRAHYSHGEELEEVKDILSWFKKPGAGVLDLGCGTGRHAAVLARMGFDVVGLDVSGPAVAAARRLCRGSKKARFFVSDLEDDGLAGYGARDLVLGLGNTVSHISRERLLSLFSDVRSTLAEGGAFFFNAIYWANPFQKTVSETGPDGKVNIVWERALSEETGTVSLKGHFIRESSTHVLNVRCYKVPEMVNLLRLAGFNKVSWSNRMDMRGRALKGANTVYYKASAARQG